MSQYKRPRQLPSRPALELRSPLADHEPRRHGRSPSMGESCGTLAEARKGGGGGHRVSRDGGRLPVAEAASA